MTLTDPSPAPPWGDPATFDEARAARLIAGLRADLAAVRATQAAPPSVSAVVIASLRRDLAIEKTLRRYPGLSNLVDFLGQTPAEIVHSAERLARAYRLTAAPNTPTLNSPAAASPATATDPTPEGRP